MRKVRIIGFFVVSLLMPESILADQDVATEKSPEYVMWMGGAKGRHDYEKAIAELVLAKSREKYGDCTLSIIDDIREIERVRVESTLADRFQLHVSPDDESIAEAKDVLVRVPQPVARGLLGYRRLIIRSEDRQKFKQINSLADLRQFKAGQGRQWPDTLVLRHNGIEVVEAINISSLFAMLKKKRFDFIPLSVSEIDGTLAAVQQRYPDFTIEDNIVVFYPLAAYFYVSRYYPTLAQRLEYGISNAFADGSYDQLFNHYFRQSLDVLKRRNNKVFVLENRLYSTSGVSATPVLAAGARP